LKSLCVVLKQTESALSSLPYITKQATGRLLTDRVPRDSLHRPQVMPME